ncbi:hypothetical protein E2C01_026651 [Portunus trituberculatus]|uniref:Uncharacterized protein n=1 Tax=Portunus trituberculatus TaxID=210409 RepID=A0A5B7EJ63_PORTR|nr:hypothetical protein [Portunus trituberculatus]
MKMNPSFSTITVETQYSHIIYDHNNTFPVMCTTGEWDSQASQHTDQVLCSSMLTSSNFLHQQSSSITPSRVYSAVYNG